MRACVRSPKPRTPAMAPLRAAVSSESRSRTPSCACSVAIFCVPSPGTRSSSRMPDGARLRSVSWYEDRPVPTSSSMTRAVASPMPGVASSSPAAMTSPRSRSSLSSARAAERYARARKRLRSPLTSSNVAISSSTRATACLSIGDETDTIPLDDRGGMPVDVTKRAHRELQRLRVRRQRTVALQLAAREHVVEITAIGTCLYVRPLRDVAPRLERDRHDRQARPADAHAETQQHVEPLSARTLFRARRAPEKAVDRLSGSIIRGPPPE